ncbi:RHS repeat domain-containing protein, partial [Zooshikella harenae]
YIHADHLNTPRRATNTEGNIVWAWYSDAYGVGQVEDNPDGDGQAVTLNLRFPGQYFDAESGLFYNYFRDYDPSTGRYIESDPIGLAGGLNTYAYVEGNPVGYIDPLGLDRYGHNYKVTDTRSNWTEEDWCRLDQSMDTAFEVAFAVATVGEGYALIHSGKFAFKHIFQSVLKRKAAYKRAREAFKKQSAEVDRLIKELTYANRPNVNLKVPGGVAGAIRHTKKTGELVGGSDHIQKGRDILKKLKKIRNRIKNSRMSEAEKNSLLFKVDKNIDDLSDALK